MGNICKSNMCNHENNVLTHATHVLGNIMHGRMLLVPMNQRILNKINRDRNIKRQNCFHD